MNKTFALAQPNAGLPRQLEKRVKCVHAVNPMTLIENQRGITESLKSIQSVFVVKKRDKNRKNIEY